MFIIQIGRVTPTKSWGEIPLKQTVDWIRCRYWLPNESPCETLSLVDTFSPSKSACYLCIPSFYCLHEVFDAQVVWLSKFRNYRPIAIRKRHGKSPFLATRFFELLVFAHDGLWRTFLPAAHNPAAWWIVQLNCISVEFFIGSDSTPDSDAQNCCQVIQSKIVQHPKYLDQLLMILIATFTTGLVFARWLKQGVAKMSPVVPVVL